MMTVYSETDLDELAKFAATFRELDGIFFSYTLSGLSRMKSKSTDEYEDISRHYLPRDFGSSIRSNCVAKIKTFALPLGHGVYYTELIEEYTTWAVWLRETFDELVDSIRTPQQQKIIEDNIEILKTRFKRGNMPLYTYEELIDNMQMRVEQPPNPMAALSFDREYSEYELNYVASVRDRMRRSLITRLATGTFALSQVVVTGRKTNRSFRAIVREINRLKSADVFKEELKLLGVVEHCMASYYESRDVNFTELDKVIRTTRGRLKEALIELRDAISMKTRTYILRSPKN